MIYTVLIILSLLAGWLAHNGYQKRMHNLKTRSSNQTWKRAHIRKEIKGVIVNSRRQNEAEQIPLTIETITQSQTSEEFIVSLTHQQNEILRMVMGRSEALAIGLELTDIKPNRPMSSDVLQTLVLLGDFSVKEVIIDTLVDSIFYATVVLQSEGGEVELDARPSDAFVIALKNEAPIYTYPSVIYSDVRASKKNDKPIA